MLFATSTSAASTSITATLDPAQPRGGGRTRLGGRRRRDVTRVGPPGLEQDESRRREGDQHQQEADLESARSAGRYAAGLRADRRLVGGETGHQIGDRPEE